MSMPRCPHCGYEFDHDDIWHSDATEFPHRDDGETTQTKCLSCGIKLTIMLRTTPSWSFYDENENEIHYSQYSRINKKQKERGFA